MICCNSSPTWFYSYTVFHCSPPPPPEGSICVVETWLGSEINSSEIDIPGYQLFRKDRNRQGSGVLMYIADFMSVTILPDPDPQLELLALSVRYNNFS